MKKYRRIINGECSFEMIELFDDVKKAANNSNSGELVECKIKNLKIDFTTVKRSMMEQIRLRLQKLKDLQAKNMRNI